MKRRKSFDCVEFKNKIQEQLTAEYDGLTDEEIEARVAEKLATSDYPMARLWRELTAAEKTAETR